MTTCYPALGIRHIECTTRPECGQKFLWCGSLRGFGIRLTNGSATFIINYRIYGKQRRIKIAPYGVFTVAEARQEAKALLGDVARGIDPSIELKRRRRGTRPRRRKCKADARPH